MVYSEYSYHFHAIRQHMKHISYIQLSGTDIWRVVKQQTWWITCFAQTHIIEPPKNAASLDVMWTAMIRRLTAYTVVTHVFNHTDKNTLRELFGNKLHLDSALSLQLGCQEDHLQRSFMAHSAAEWVGGEWVTGWLLKSLIQPAAICTLTLVWHKSFHVTHTLYLAPTCTKRPQSLTGQVRDSCLISPQAAIITT